jgi:XTP/dITP diphosphohydrolase
MIKRITLVLATRNNGKTREFRNLLKGFDVEILDLTSLAPIPEVEEDGDSFEDNAYKKAHFAARTLGLPAMGDDSGLVVDALGGVPGVLSARYAGDSATDDDNNAKLLLEMEGKENRDVRFVCVIAIAVPSGQALIFYGKCEGLLTSNPAGKGGFGYDPLFYYPPLAKTFAELSLEEKGKVSHRGKALSELQKEFDKALVWIRQRISEEKI